ncbi:TnsD family transposase [Paenibacillus sp. MZ04-78.2]|uniref:TnsD family Tn7-like transposition protein n=1 Tax=Paenibacillus sp. MZ04-78.2 TaxID=2962034 RepID=UPI0020B7456C|nr:TnsD family Tn7-like transposition protein [Paenibacillus sp. MZ04-78.2]MCP3776685.1 TnsD family transposase [Paenibacillus sp. MZ04-78.2]
MGILSSFFPPLFPDELLYSTLARYHLYVGNHSRKATMADLYNGSVFSAVTLLPAHLGQISHLMRENMTPLELMQSHTLFPYFSTFLSEERSQLVASAMTGDLGRAINARLGLIASSIKMPQYLRFCMQCLFEDEMTYGLPYWHRSHQLPGVFICYKHGCGLKNSEISTFLRRNKQEYVCLNRKLACNEVIGLSMNEGLKVHLTSLAVQSHTLLNTPCNSVNYRLIEEFYNAKLFEKGFITLSGNIRFQSLRSKMIESLGQELLSLCDSEISKHSHDTWLHKLVRGGEHTHTLRHLLLILFLNETTDIVFQKKVDIYHPFGTGPWPCLNKAADHYKKEIVTQCKVTRCSDTKRPVGAFICDCGFIYSRRGPDTNVSDRFHIGRIKQFGEVWEKRFDELQLRTDLTIRKKAELLGVHYSTVYAKIKSNPKVASGFSNSDIVSKERAACRTISKTRFKVPSRNAIRSRVNWEERDRKLLPAILQAVSDIKSATDKPIRITLPEIGRRISKLSLLEKKLVALPRCKALIKSEVETLQQFQLRRVNIAARKLFEEGLSVVRWKVIRKAGLRKEIAYQLNNEIDKVIENYL